MVHCEATPGTVITADMNHWESYGPFCWFRKLYFAYGKYVEQRAMTRERYICEGTVWSTSVFHGCNQKLCELCTYTGLSRYRTRHKVNTEVNIKLQWHEGAREEHGDFLHKPCNFASATTSVVFLCSTLIHLNSHLSLQTLIPTAMPSFSLSLWDHFWSHLGPNIGSNTTIQRSSLSTIEQTISLGQEWQHCGPPGHAVTDWTSLTVARK